MSHPELGRLTPAAGMTFEAAWALFGSVVRSLQPLEEAEGGLFLLEAKAPHQAVAEAGLSWPLESTMACKCWMAVALQSGWAVMAERLAVLEDMLLGFLMLLSVEAALPEILLHLVAVYLE